MASRYKDRTELHEFSAEQVEEAVKMFAKLAIVGKFFRGKINSQRIERTPDGGMRVISEVSEDML
jgi:hypothetical protein